MSSSLIATPPTKRRMWLRSLTSRLVAGVVSLVVVLVFAIGACTFYALKSFLYDRLDQQLTTTATRSSVPDLLNQHKLSFGGPLEVPQTIWVAVVSDATGRPTSYQPQGPDLTPLNLPAGTMRDLAGRDTGPATRRTADHSWVRTVSISGLELTTINGASQISQNVTVIVGLSENDLRRTLGRTIAVELIIGLSAVCVAFLATSLGVQRSLRNLYRVTGTAQEVAAELSPEGAGLDRRVPVVEEGTEVGQLAESVNTLLAAVETQFKARVESENRMRQFLADASHELRTPLTSIRGYAELARMQRAAGDVEQDNLDRIESEGTRMSRLVDDLLLLARGDASGATHLEQRTAVDLDDIVDDAVSGSRAAFPDRPIDTEISPLPAVLGDRDQLLRAIRNLVTNAAVHTAAGRPILVRAFADAGGAVVMVSDGGPGLPPEQAAHVFERFWRADKARTRARGGSGLGLSIVAAIVRAHGGSVQFDSSVERGSTVTMWLPAMAE
jgi:two-component system OmpR family sensor kinase